MQPELRAKRGQRTMQEMTHVLLTDVRGVRLVAFEVGALYVGHELGLRDLHLPRAKPELPDARQLREQSLQRGTAAVGAT